ncbi:MAG: hypothetical protein ACOZNI_29865 [Myxococcota bacterium]
MIALVLLAGCPLPEDDDDDKSDDTGETEPPPEPTEDTSDTGRTETTRRCDVTLDATVPADGDTDVFVGDDVEFHLSDPDRTATIVTTIPGTQETSDDGETVYWRLAEPLEPSTAYEVTLEYCGGDATIGFRTSELGEPLATSLEGRTWAFGIQDGRVVEPEGIGSVLTAYATRTWLVSATEESATELTLLYVPAVEGSDPPEQDTCVATETVVADLSDSPAFTLSGIALDVDFSGATVTLDDATVSGTFASDGTWIGGGELSYTVDTRPLAPLVDESGDEGVICDLVVSFGSECVACSDGEPYCLDFLIDQLVAEEVDVEVVEAEACE